MGYAGYDLARQIEPRVPVFRKDDLKAPDAVFMFFTSVLVFDHVRHQIYVIANARTAGQDDLEGCYRAALAEIESLEACLSKPVVVPGKATNTGPLDPVSNIGRETFCAGVEKAREYILAGDIFQVVLSQRLEMEPGVHPFQIYRALRTVNPSPYLFYLQLGEMAIVGSSPEMLVKVEGRTIEYRPIAGTRPRGATPEEDSVLAEDLLADAKEIAEHVMLVDLGRNDVGRVSEYGSVRVPEFKIIEYYSHVMHIVSSVFGTLREGYDAFDTLKACFPAGTVSGAPKVRAMEIIAEIEPTKRGVYSGSVMYLDFSGSLTSAIAIRTMMVRGKKAYLPGRCRNRRGFGPGARMGRDDEQGPAPCSRPWNWPGPCSAADLAHQSRRRLASRGARTDSATAAGSREQPDGHDDAQHQQQRRPWGIGRAARQVRRDRQQRRGRADPDAEHQQERILREDQTGDRSPCESQSLQQSQFPAPLQHAPDHHHRQAECAEQQAEPSESQEGAEVGVLDDQELGQALGGAGGVEAFVGKGVLQRGGGVGRLGLGKQRLKAGVIRIQVQEVSLGHHELGLEYAPRQQPGQDQAALCALGVLDDQFVAEAQVQDPGHRVGVAEDRDSGRRSPPPAAARDWRARLRTRPGSSGRRTRPARSGVPARWRAWVAWAGTGFRQLASSPVRTRRGMMVIAPSCSVSIRSIAERKSGRPPRRTVGIPVTGIERRLCCADIPAVHRHRHDHERRARDQSCAKHAAGWIAPPVPNAEPGDAGYGIAAPLRSEQRRAEERSARRSATGCRLRRTPPAVTRIRPQRNGQQGDGAGACGARDQAQPSCPRLWAGVPSAGSTLPASSALGDSRVSPAQRQPDRDEHQCQGARHADPEVSRPKVQVEERTPTAPLHHVLSP